MATLDMALDAWPGGAEADWHGLHLDVTRADERHNGVDWEGWSYSVYAVTQAETTPALVACDNADTRDDLLVALAAPPVSLPADFVGWYWTDYRGQRHD